MIQKVLSDRSRTEDDILYVSLKKRTNDEYVNVNYKDFIKVNGDIEDPCDMRNPFLLEDKSGGMRIVLNNGDYLGVYEYDSSTGLEYIEYMHMPIENIDMVQYNPDETTF